MDETEVIDTRLAHVIANLAPGGIYSEAEMLIGTAEARPPIATQIGAAHNRLRNRLNSAIHRARKLQPGSNFVLRGTQSLTREGDVVVSQLVIRIDEGDPLYAGDDL